MLNKKVEDLTKVFDRTWRANHNDDVKMAREQEKNLMNKLYDNGKANFKVERMTPSQEAQKLQNNMNNAFMANRSVNLGKITKK